MRFALTQMDIVWENPVENRRLCTELTEQAAAQGCDWIVFPEMTLTGFTMHPELFAEPEGIGSSTADFFCSLSRGLSIGIIYGYIASHADSYTNRLVYVRDGMILQEYAKLHPFSFGEESKHYIAGDKLSILSLPDICISGFICYDLRFPEIFQISSEKSEVIFVIANWPKSRIDQWDTLLKARAIENQVFMVGVNRTGEGDGLHYNGHSAIYSPNGEAVTTIREEECLLIGDINPEEIKEMRKTFPMKNDRREELYIKMWENAPHQ